MVKYQLEGGLRRVQPYFRPHTAPFRPRWEGKSVVEILTTELGQSLATVNDCLEKGHLRVSVNNGRATPTALLSKEESRSRLLANHDVIHNVVHTHEPPVLSTPISIISDAEYLVVDKPSGIPTHPGGIYRYNTVSEVLKDKLKTNLHPCHRLDKGTLGVLVFAKRPQDCAKMMDIISKKENTEKWYLARVRGRLADATVCSPVFTMHYKGGYINVKSPKKVPAKSTTVFKRLKYLSESDESIVLCRPLSGKMHQIRIHLRNLGHPISNDPVYAPTKEGDKVKNQIELGMYLNLAKTYNTTVTDFSKGPCHVDVESTLVEFEEDIKTMKALSKEQAIVVGTCDECKANLYQENIDPGIFLHAYRLTNPGTIDFRTAVPIWADCSKEDIDDAMILQ